MRPPAGAADLSPETVLAAARPFRVRLAVPFRGLTHRSGLLLEGPSGWGEFSPFPDYDVAADARWLAAALEAAYGRWPRPVRDRVPVNAIIPAVSPATAAGMVRQAGCATVKVKVGDADDIARVAAVREALGDGGLIRVDGNGAWDVPTAVARLRALEPFGLDYAEQPCRTVAELVALRQRTDVRIAGDEIIRIDGMQSRLTGIVDVAVLKVSPLGGVARTLAVAARVGVPVVISSAMETSVGLSAGLAAAAALPDLYGACGLGTGRLLAEDTTAPLVPDHGWLTVTRRAPGGLRPAGDLDYWAARLRAAWPVLHANTPGSLPH